MLFDLRGRGRRRTIQVIYLSLAVLMGGGLVFFGIGGSVSGGLFDAVGLTGNSNSSGGGSDILNKQEKTAVKRVTVNPRDAAGWAAVARIRYQRAGQGRLGAVPGTRWTDARRRVAETGSTGRR